MCARASYLLKSRYVRRMKRREGRWREIFFLPHLFFRKKNTPCGTLKIMAPRDPKRRAIPCENDPLFQPLRALRTRCNASVPRRDWQQDGAWRFLLETPQGGLVKTADGLRAPPTIPQGRGNEKRQAQAASWLHCARGSLSLSLSSLEARESS